MFFGDLLRNTVVTAQVNRYADGRDAFHLYLRDSMRANMPYDQMAREILVSSGANDGRYYPEEFDSYQQFVDLTEDYEGNPVTPTPSSYIVGGLTRGGPLHDTWDAMANNVARDFLGISQMDCILCHDGDGHLDSISVLGGDRRSGSKPGSWRPFSPRPCSPGRAEFHSRLTVRDALGRAGGSFVTRVKSSTAGASRSSCSTRSTPQPVTGPPGSPTTPAAPPQSPRFIPLVAPLPKGASRGARRWDVR